MPYKEITNSKKERFSISDKKYRYIIFNEKNGIGTITLNRPNHLNALQYPLIMEIIDALEYSRREKKIRVIVIKGKGRAFSSGDDLKGMAEDGSVRFKPLPDGSRIPHQKCLRLIREIPKPVIALVHGYCLGAGFELALACDLRLASDDLEIGDHRSSRAICVLCGASWLLPRIVGFGRATDIIFTGRHLNAKEALEIGLVSRVYPVSEFKEKSREFIEKMAEMPTKCLGYDKMMLNYSQINDFVPSLQNEFNLYCRNIATSDFGEGMYSFMKKREPKFIGR